MIYLLYGDFIFLPILKVINWKGGEDEPEIIRIYICSACLNCYTGLVVPGAIRS